MEFSQEDLSAVFSGSAVVYDTESRAWKGAAAEINKLTIEAAHAIGKSRLLGSIENGKAADLAEAQKLEPKPEKFVVSRDLCAKGCLLKDVLPVLLPLWGERPQVNGFLDRSCYYEEYLGRYNVVCLTWRKKLAAACLNGSRKEKLWMQRPILSLTVAGDGNNTYKVRVLDRNKEILSENVVVREWKTFKIDLVDAGTVRDGVYRKAVPLGSLRIEFSPVYGWDGSAFIAGISIEEGE